MPAPQIKWNVSIVLVWRQKSQNELAQNQRKLTQTSLHGKS